MVTDNICFKKGDKGCDLEIYENNSIFIAMQYDKYRDIIYERGIVPVVQKLKMQIIRADKSFENRDIFCKICKQIQEATLILVEISDNNSNVFIELGMAIGFGKKIILIREKDECNKEKKKVPLDISGTEYFEYTKLDDFLDYESENGLYSIMNKYVKEEDEITQMSFSIKPTESKEQKFSPEINPIRIIKGRDFVTSVEFIGSVTGGFFDNCIKNEKGEVVKWNPDPNTMPNRGSLNQGIINDDVEVSSSWVCDTKKLEVGKYKVLVRLYEHPIQGEKRRYAVKECPIDIEIVPET